MPLGSIESRCDKCGLPISFKRLPNGRWSPTNPDGTDHWDKCKEVQRKAWGLINPDGTVNWAKLHSMGRKATTGPTVGWFYCGDVPPWDESLGQFRSFNEAEKAEGLVCYRFPY